MCETLQLNWKLPTTPMEAISSPFSAIKGNNTKKKMNNRVTRNDIFQNIEKVGSHKETTMVKKENSNNNNRMSSIREKRSKVNQKCSMLMDVIPKTSNRKSDGKYILRDCSIKKRSETEVKKSQPKKRGPKPRPKPQPMSKYRRKTANLRERERMGEINTAFDHLKEKIPTPLVISESPKPCGNEKRNRCEKMTKINVLHIAINYIRALESILDTGDAGTHVYGTSIIQSPRLSVPNSFYPNLDMAKENENISNDLENQKPLRANNSRAETPTSRPIKNLKYNGKYKKRTRKAVSSPKIGSLKGNKKMTKNPVKKEPKSKNELLFNANICEKLNQLQPVQPFSIPVGSSISETCLIKNKIIGAKVSKIKDESECSLQEYCPDWTELTPTLQFPPVAQNYDEGKERSGPNIPRNGISSITSTQYSTIENDSNPKITQNMTRLISTSDKTKEYKYAFCEPNGSAQMSTSEKIRNPSAVPSLVGKSGDNSNFSKLHSLPTSKYPLISCQESFQLTAPPRGNLDTLLSSSADKFSLDQENKEQIKLRGNTNISFAQRKMTNISKPSMSILNCDLIFKTSVPWLNNSPSPPIFGRQPSFPDVFGTADDPDFLFGELTKSSLTPDEVFLVDEEISASTYVNSTLGSCSKSFSMSSENGSMLSSDGSPSSSSSSDENDVSIMDYINDTFQISI